jgi:hypothetical protein
VTSGVFEIHAADHLCPILGIDTTFAGMHNNDGVGTIVLAIQSLLQFEIFHRMKNAIQLGFDFRHEIGFAAGEFDQILQVGGGLREFLPAVEPGLEFAHATHALLGGFLIVPVTGLTTADFEIFYFSPVVGEVKVAPRVLPAVRLRL